MPDIYNGLSESATATESVIDGLKVREVSLYLPKNPEVVDYDRRQSLWFWLESIENLRRNNTASIASHENPLRTPSAGAISFFYDKTGRVRYVAMAQKDAGSPRDPGFRVPRNGYPHSREDWTTMGHLYREAFEEGIILTRNNELVLSLDGNYDDIIREQAAFLESNTPLKIKGETRLPILFKEGLDTLLVYNGDELAYKGHGAISWTPETGVNFVKQMVVQHPLEELLLVDAESFPNGKPIGRDYCVLDLDKLTGKKFGDPIHETVHRVKEGDTFLDEVKIFERDDLFLTDRVPRSLLCQTMHNGQPIYPIDWIDEAYAFLSDPKVQAAYSNAFAASTLERKMKVKK
jgi:hypothetical protein